MVNQSNSKVVGAFVVGLALVALAYILNNFGQSYSIAETPQSVRTVEAPLRQPIPVKDSNQDGVEDWQEEFVRTSVVDLTNAGTNYTAPTSTTEQVSLNFFENFVRAKGYGDFGPSTDEVVKSTVNTITESAKDKIYDVTDIILKEDTSPQAIRNYANEHANAIIKNNVPGLRDPLIILKEIVEGRGEKSIEELETMRDVYLNTKNSVLEIEVPKNLAKEHLDLINVYNALYEDIRGMTLALEDPLIALVRLKRFEEDTLALTLTLQNMSEALAVYNFDYQDFEPATFFLIFNPELQ